VEMIIEVRDLRKRFGDVQALAGVDFDLAQGELFGLLGPNGAGKTTTINLLTGLARLGGGAVRIAGIDCTRSPKAAQHLIGVVPDESNLYPELSGFDNLCFCGALYGMPAQERRVRAGELMEIFGLSDAGGRKFAGYSKGMKRKLTVAAGIIQQPRILFLDEPTTGIDVASARRIRQMVADLRRSGTTILLTTHYIEEAERLCDRIAFLVAGRIVRTDTVANLMQPVQGRHVMQLRVSGSPATACGRLESMFPQMQFHALDEKRIRTESCEPIRAGLLVRFLEEQDIEVIEARLVRPTLEDIFVQVTGIEAAAMQKEKEKPGGPA